MNSLNTQIANNDTYRNKLKAAYALNLCTVSVSQIIDYQDVYILEQEYDAILNNLNLKEMPKDEPLLKIITELLNTITFFRIQEIKKNQIEKKYRQRMNNAIWSAIPSISVVVAGDPVAIAFSLATQIGSGYMNYRNEKAKASSEKEDQEIELQITAIEQLNALRRELFTTAWRLADTYDFPDEWRLTEKQIKQYNNILMDKDEYRKYVRLESIADKFAAYPPFWYFYGHTANYIAEMAKNRIKDNSQDTEELKQEYEDGLFEIDYYTKLAKKHYEHYYEMIGNNLLREDQLTATFALEYVDILYNDTEKDIEKIKALLALARKMAPNSFDILQLCAISYLKVGMLDEASKLLKILVNENYNTILNAQILSQLYVDRYMTNSDKEKKIDYEFLANRISRKYLFPFPKESETFAELVNQFLNSQKKIVNLGFQRLMRSLYQKYVIELNQLIPPVNKTVNEAYFSNAPQNKEVRYNEMRRLLSLDNLPQDYQYELKKKEMIYEFIVIINKLLNSVSTLHTFIDDADIVHIISSVNEYLADNKTIINEIQKNMREGKLTYEDFSEIESIFEITVKRILREVLPNGTRHISSLNLMSDISKMETELITLCDKENISADILAANDFIANTQLDNSMKLKFSMEIFGEDASLNQTLISLKENIVNIIKNYSSKIILPESEDRCKILLNGNIAFDEYIDTNKFGSLYLNAKSKIAAFIVDKKSHFDMIITSVGIYIIKYAFVGKSLELLDLVPYDSISLYNNNTLLLNGAEYRNRNINIPEFMNMVKEIKDCSFRGR